MALTINGNIGAISAMNSLNRNNRGLSSTFERISSGKRINRASDDAAGLAIAENMSAQSRSAEVAMRNTNDGISLAQVAEGSTAEVGDILKRMRELAVQASSETLATAERQYLEDESAELIVEVGRIASQTEFNGVSLTDGSVATIDVQVGLDASAASQVTITLGDMRAATLGIAALDISTTGGAGTAITAIDAALDTVSGARADYGAATNRMGHVLNSMETYSTNLQSAESTIRDADFAQEAADMAKQQILQQAGISVLAQANSMNAGVLTLIG